MSSESTMAQPAGSEQQDIVSTMAELLKQQAAAAQQREERLAGMIAQLMERGANTSGDTARTTSGDTPNATRNETRKHGIATGAIPAPRLSGAANLREFATWKEKFEGYSKLTGIDKLPDDEQKAVFLTLLDDEWVRIVKFGLTDDTSSGDGENDTITKLILNLEKHIRRQRNVILDRRDFYLRRQEQGERFDDFFMSLKETSQFCDFCETCADDRFRDRILTGIRDEETVRVLLSEKDLSLQKTLDICRARENAIQDSIALTSSHTAIQAVKPRHDGGKSGKACGYCGGAWHDNLKQCPARKSKCTKCNKFGHLAVACRNESPEDDTRRRR